MYNLYTSELGPGPLATLTNRHTLLEGPELLDICVPLSTITEALAWGFSLMHRVSTTILP
jgi:hypothetical protein